MGLVKDILTAIEIMIKRDASMNKELLEAASVDDDAFWNDIKLGGSVWVLYCDVTPCDVCGKVFTSKWNVKEHRNSVHDGIRFLCNQCDYIAVSEQNLEENMRRVWPPILARRTGDVSTCS